MVFALPKRFFGGRVNLFFIKFFAEEVIILAEFLNGKFGIGAVNKSQAKIFAKS